MDNLSEGQDVLYVSNGKDPFPRCGDGIKYNAVVIGIDPKGGEISVQLNIVDHMNGKSWIWWVYDDEIYSTTKLKQLPYQEGLI